MYDSSVSNSRILEFLGLFFFIYFAMWVPLKEISSCTVNKFSQCVSHQAPTYVPNILILCSLFSRGVPSTHFDMPSGSNCLTGSYGESHHRLLC